MGFTAMMRVWSACAVALLLVCVHAEQEDDMIQSLREDSEHDQVLIHGLELGAPGPTAKAKPAPAPAAAAAAKPAGGAKAKIKEEKKVAKTSVADLKKQMAGIQKKIKTTQKKSEKKIGALEK